MSTLPSWFATLGGVDPGPIRQAEQEGPGSRRGVRRDDVPGRRAMRHSAPTGVDRSGVLSTGGTDMIDSYEFGRIVIDGQTFTSDVIIFPDRVDANWWRKEGHRLQLADLEGIWEAQPELLVVGTGATGRMEVAPEVARRLSDQGV
ncbi:MAG TPA: hypothetical protein EYH34_16375, partial [Planctomycetes bacterium]|nr:hypothetical protein [Planctomycetota bacterium]